MAAFLFAMLKPPFNTPQITGFVPPVNFSGALSPAAPPAAETNAEIAALLAPKPKPEPSAAKNSQPSAPPDTDADQDLMTVLVVRGAQELKPWIAAWQNLADAACEPNVFYEPWMVMPALQTFAPRPAPEFHLIFAPGRGPDSAQPQLCGLFPLVRERRYKGLRASVLRGWKYLYCPLGTPLLRRGVEAQTLDALLDYLAAQQRGASLLELGCVSGDGPFGRALVEVFCERGTTTFVDESWTRAFLRTHAGASGEDYLKGAMSGKRRKEFRRKEHRLADEGEVRYRELENEADPDAALGDYIADFLRLEASGWKGETGSAFACDPAHREFFRAVVTQAHYRGRLMLATLRVDGRAIAAKCDFLAGTGAFAFKIGFDEEYARFSPGVLLEIEAIRQLHQDSKVRWMDSCAVRNHPMINRLWTERRTLQTVAIATGRGRGEFVVAGLSLLRHFKRAARRPRQQKTAAQNLP